ncbi:SDR family oxidoreductase [Pseudoalteromonas luteoviolacea]|uniref:dTDP-4-dehydrorhamnose reductase n=1 Tax=Pseudoalteromonas luteoviolacea H33 TaxID=1365251 RepID=A0A162ABR1_9GAMM|nr:sugar nucleotide-binding protein [Pseudoalteromonas luteoviolacea]KZN47193.1 hypothetical protein N476_23730 [Pseudoalteromonas luteoviolacea H33]KZN77191.1 hypothetical protein N477_12460 [Pseudoalteromonas luteoviolacea H33-S]MBQ4879344.1 sugar nucleotide-binding protein [Pseudoalteromonas luteoviolacea]MBQ4908404.1 sugar nucleotide-binding protein [Pseudoalteromonas luteoviolacea]
MEKTQQITPIIFGASGLLGGHLFKYFGTKNSQTIGTYGQNYKPDLIQFDLAKNDLDSLKIQPENKYVAVICASLTNIGYINANPLESFDVNVRATEKLIKQLTSKQIPIVFISSDNVFPGSSGAYRDDNSETPVSEYGVQKREIESRLMKITGNNACVVRLAKIVGVAGQDGTILNDIVNQLASGNEVKAASDLIFNPTAVTDIVRAIELLIQERKTGIFNFCNPQVFSRFDLTTYLANALNLDTQCIRDIKFAELDSTGKRPLNTTMINSSIFENFQFTDLETCVQLGLEAWRK